MTIWFSSDPHFGHWNLVHKFVHAGKPARPFASVEEMDEIIIAKHNAVVMPNDHWYCLGDVVMHLPNLDRIMPRLAGHKRLVRGNHDIFKTRFYLKYFEEIHATRQLDGLLFSHIPIAPWCFNRAVKANVHGHTHLSDPLTYRVPNPRGSDGFAKSQLYVNLSMERTNYAPMSLEQIQKLVARA